MDGHGWSVAITRAAIIHSMSARAVISHHLDDSRVRCVDLRGVPLRSCPGTYGQENVSGAPARAELLTGDLRMAEAKSSMAGQSLLRLSATLASSLVASTLGVGRHGAIRTCGRRPQEPNGGRASSSQCPVGRNSYRCDVSDRQRQGERSYLYAWRRSRRVSAPGPVAASEFGARETPSDDSLCVCFQTGTICYGMYDVTIWLIIILAIFIPNYMLPTLFPHALPPPEVG
jgi:hypothetical protein